MHSIFLCKYVFSYAQVRHLTFSESLRQQIGSIRMGVIYIYSAIYRHRLNFCVSLLAFRLAARYILYGCVPVDDGQLSIHVHVLSAGTHPVQQ